jgi:hypothetical protein
MARIDYFKTGREQYLNKDYKAAAESFAKGIVEEHSNACEGWLGRRSCLTIDYSRSIQVLIQLSGFRFSADRPRL